MTTNDPNRRPPSRPWLTHNQQQQHDLKQARLQTFLEQQAESVADLSLHELHAEQYPEPPTQKAKLPPTRPSWYPRR